MKSIVTLFLACLLVGQSFSVLAEDQAKTYVAGKDYEVLPEPVVTRNKHKVEVVELFWYGCPHCFEFEPMLEAWKAKLPPVADYYQMPAMWSSKMELHAKGFYVAKALGILDEVHEPLFNLMHVEKKRIDNRDELAAFFKRFGVDKDAFDRTFDSFSVESQINIAKSRAVSYHMQGTPELIVNGKYRVSTTMAGSQANMLKIASFLIEQESKKLPKKK